jgi:hypothetical protein
MSPKLRRLSGKQHDELDAGTLRAIIRQAARYVPEEQLRPHFWAQQRRN